MFSFFSFISTLERTRSSLLSIETVNRRKTYIDFVGSLPAFSLVEMLYQNITMVNCSVNEKHCERSSKEVTIFVAIYIALSLVVITGNTLVIASYTLNPKLRKGITVFFVSLAISDLCVGILPIPYWIISLLVPYIRESLNNHFSSFDIFSALASIFNLVAISIERRVVLSANFEAHFSFRKTSKA